MTGSAIVTGLLTAAAGVVFLLVPGRNPLGDPSLMILSDVLMSGRQHAVLYVVAGLVAAATALVVGAVSPQAGRPLLAVVAAAELVFAVALSLNVLSISLLGYLVAFCVPAAMVALVVQLLRKYPVARLPISLAVLAGVAGLTWQHAYVGDLLATVGRNLGSGLVAAAWKELASLTAALTGLTWAAVIAVLLRDNGALDPVRVWVLRHRKTITLLAAAGPLPYALMRSTWLTPITAFAPGDIEPSTRLWGLLLGSGAVIGIVLTIGLIRPWGERFPRWMPGVGGRRVPIAAAAVPGGIVAGVLCLCAVPMLVLPLAADGRMGGWLEMTLVLPLWFWGPMLAFAVWGYVEHRRQRTLTG